MKLSGLFPLVQEAPAYRDLLASVEQGTVSYTHLRAHET